MQADPQPHAGFEQLEDSVAAGENLDISIFFANFPCTDQNDDGTCDSDDTFTTVTYRFDLLQGSADGPDADNCEGSGFGTVPQFQPFAVQSLEHYRDDTSNYRQELHARFLCGEVYDHLYQRRLDPGDSACL